MQATAVPSRATRREQWSWYLYDFGNSAYAAVVLLAVFSAYFQDSVVGGPEGTRLWGIAIGIAMLVVAVTSPVLGAIADFSGAKKRLLGFYTAIACTFTALLFFVQQGDVVMGMVFFILAEIGYRSAQVFYNGLLPEVAAPEELGRVSGTGWAVGSAGGIVCLLIVLPLIVIIGGESIVRVSLVITAVFFALSSLPIFLILRERAQPQRLPAGQNYLTIGFGRLWKTFKKARQYREFLKFMVAFLIYNDGVIMALDFAAIIGVVLYGMTQEQLIIFIIVVQVTNVFGAYAFGIITDRSSTKRALGWSLVAMIAAVIWLYFNLSITGFFLIGAVAGIAMAGIQSVSRTFVSQLSPPGQSAEFFGLFAVVGRTSSFIGPTIYGILAAGVANRLIARGELAELAEQTGQRIAILSIAAFLMVGLLLLLLVNEQRGVEAARSASPEGQLVD